jgi:pimeloyl-ACP methyl ester carboxylesterase
MEQKLGSARLPGGTTVAFATAGDGPLLLFIGGWFSHLEVSRALPAERHLFEGLARGRTLIRYDRPGCGLSDRPAQASASLESELNVLAAVIGATDAERVEVMASSPGFPVAVAWAAGHPGNRRPDGALRRMGARSRHRTGVGTRPKGTWSASGSGSDSAPGHRSRPGGWRRAPDDLAESTPSRRGATRALPSTRVKPLESGSFLGSNSCERGRDRGAVGPPG